MKKPLLHASWGPCFISSNKLKLPPQIEIWSTNWMLLSPKFKFLIIELDLKKLFTPTDIKALYYYFTLLRARWREAQPSETELCWIQICNFGLWKQQKNIVMILCVGLPSDSFVPHIFLSDPLGHRRTFSVFVKPLWTTTEVFGLRRTPSDHFGLRQNPSDGDSIGTTES